MTDPDIDLRLTPSQLQTIGLLTARWAYFETEMDSTIAALGELVERNQRLPQPFNQRSNRWRKLARQFYKTEPTALHNTECLIDAAQDLREVRRRIVHGRMDGGPKPRSRTIYIENHRHLDEWKIERHQATTQHLRRVIFEIERLTKELILFKGQYLPALPSSLPRIFQ